MASTYKKPLISLKCLGRMDDKKETFPLKGGKVKVKLSLYRPWRPLGLREGDI
jgi:hypothetical protein